jgi:signal peptidase II
VKQKTWLFFSMFAIGMVLDQGSKWLVRANIRQNVQEVEVVPGLFSLEWVENPGALAGLLGDFEYRLWVFLAFTLIAIYVIVQAWWKAAPTERYLPFTLGLLLSGALGNAVDRAIKGSVTDFLKFYVEAPGPRDTLRAWFGTNQYPTFNVADIALVVGVILLIIQPWVTKAPVAATPAPETPSGE